MNRVTQVQNFARAGYLARAIVYFLIGYIALTTGKGSGASDILDRIEALPGGLVILGLTGLVASLLWELPVLIPFENWWVWVSSSLKTGGFGFQTL